MKVYITAIALIALLLSSNTVAQSPSWYLRGVILEESIKGKFTPLYGATAVWMNTTIGSVSDSNGVFVIPMPLATDGFTNKLIVSYLGYKSDTLIIKNTSDIRVILASEQRKTLSEIEVTARLRSTFLNSLDPTNTKTVTEKELFKAACCNLSESFETNPSVEVQFTDAVTGAKQIQMLGLSGLYTQLNYENLPGSRGLAGSYGLGYTPGPWIESIQITKGVGSVVNGYESMAGQINVELKKNDAEAKTGERLFFNLYANSMARFDGSLNVTQKINRKWSSATLLHANTQTLPVDMNHDNFLDIPLGYQLNAMQRFKYEHKNWLIQWGAKALYEQRLGGQINLGYPHGDSTLTRYAIYLNTRRAEGFGKIGYLFPEKKYKSVGLIFNVLRHDQDNKWGNETTLPNRYNAIQNHAYVNLIYQSIIGNTHHKYRTGISFMWDEYNESLNNLTFARNELVPGAYAEYTWSSIPKFTLISGLRADYHNLFGLIITPRLHGKYDITENTALRLSGGRGQRTANPVADNFGYFISSRTTDILTRPLAETSWNYGGGLTHEFELNYQHGTFTFDFYRTDFTQQMVLDIDKSPQQLHLYALQGISYANSLQAELNYEPIKRLDIRLAYRWYDVKTTYLTGLLQRPFVAQHRAFANAAYETRNHWRFDITLHWNGAKRIPSTSANPLNYQFPEYSPHYTVINAQIAKSLGNPMAKWWDFYIGIENLTDFRQQDLIISPENPFSPYFDAALVWGPVIGRMVYAGLRYKIK